MKWFSYDYEGGISFWDTEEEAIRAAEACLENCRNCAVDDGWPDYTPSICWGQVRGQVKETERMPWREWQEREGYEPDSRFDEYIDYQLGEL